MKPKNERYRVKPGLSLKPRDIYKRYRNNTLNLSGAENQYVNDVEIMQFTRMDKMQQLNSLKETFQKTQELKQKTNG